MYGGVGAMVFSKLLSLLGTIVFAVVICSFKKASFDRSAQVAPFLGKTIKVLFAKESPIFSEQRTALLWKRLASRSLASILACQQRVLVARMQSFVCSRPKHVDGTIQR
mmetsp:Transcript_3120/g.7063  ORF Transcript_3120/g.7063 Transcript_3120/m.7063 type:complete len:109 (+) Transcript_3120:5074-5400(+)